MSTEFEKVNDKLNAKESIEIAVGTGGIRIFSTQKKIWLSIEAAREMINLLDTAIIHQASLET